MKMIQTLLAIAILADAFTLWLLQDPRYARKIRKFTARYRLTLRLGLSWLEQKSHPLHFSDRNGRIALANEVGLFNEHGRETLQIDPTDTLPQTIKYLLYMRGSSQYYAKTCDGGATLASMPLGMSSDAAYQTGDFIEVERLGATPGIRMGIASAAITIDHLVCSAAGGKVADAYTTNATVWIIGRATKSVTAAGQQISFVPCDPYLLTSNGAGTYTAATQL